MPKKNKNALTTDGTTEYGKGLFRGLFSSYTNVGQGDPYEKKSAVPDRNRGKQFQVPIMKSGTNGLFDKEVKLYSDVYKDPGVIDSKERKESRSKLPTTYGFRYSSPPKKMCGAGSYFGAFGKPTEHMAEATADKKGDVHAKVETKPHKNIVTTPGKKGTYGVPGITLSKGSEYNYTADSEADRKKAEKADKEKKQKLYAGPFKGTCKSLDFFDSQPNVAASKIYTIEPSMVHKERKDAAAAKPIVAVPFKPSNPGKNFFSTFPPVETKGGSGDKAIKKDDKKSSVTWKPCSSFSASLPIKSIAYNNTSIVSAVARNGL